MTFKPEQEDLIGTFTTPINTYLLTSLEIDNKLKKGLRLYPPWGSVNNCTM
jgi:hypothetical protein